MDSNRFDEFTRLVSSLDSRRGFLKACGGALGALLGLGAGIDARAGRCVAEPTDTTCAGKCGDVRNNCGTVVKCARCCKPDKKSKTCRNTCGPVTNNCGEIVECTPCPCDPEEPAVTCEGKCGPITNNCNEVVECGECPCVPDDDAITCDGKCGPVANNCQVIVECGECPCVPDDVSVTCADQCGPTINNCEETIDCGLCEHGEICLETVECDNGQCIDGTCCKEVRVFPPVGEGEPTCCNGVDADGHAEVYCQGTCCSDCFQNNASSGSHELYCGCGTGRELCGEYPFDECCLPQDSCLNGGCEPTVYVCPNASNPSGPDVLCQSGCCGEVCCPVGYECDSSRTCVPALTVCSTQADCDSASICTAFMGTDGFCCPSVRYYERDGFDGQTTFKIPLCCSQGMENRNCSQPCVPVHYDGCDETFRGSQPRIRP